MGMPGGMTFGYAPMGMMPMGMNMMPVSLSIFYDKFNFLNILHDSSFI